MGGDGLSWSLRPQTASDLPIAVAMLSCAIIMATFVVVFGLLQLHSRKHNKPNFAEAGPGSGLLVGLGLNRTAVAYKGIPNVWQEDEVNSESDNEEFDFHERTAFIKTQSAL